MTGQGNHDGHRDIDRLLEIEQICDQFEDRVAHGETLDVSEVLRDISRDLRSSVRHHLARITSDFEAEQAARSPHSLVSCELRCGTEFDRYRLVKQLGIGGTATVWRAVEIDSEKEVAIKISIRPDQEALQRFQREAETTTRLKHDRVVAIHRTGMFDSHPYLVTDFVDGESLAVRLQRRPTTSRQAAALLHDIAEIIQYAHKKGVIHRDLKPHNVLIDGHGKVHLTDFGLAKEITGELNSLTRTGEILGTPAYMAPEQADGNGSRADERTDVYSLGVMLFRMLTGDVPFRGTPESVIYQILHVDAPSPRSLQPAVPVELDTICGKCLEKDPADRFSSAAEFRLELLRYLEHQPIHSKAPSGLSRAWKWASRNRRLASSLLASAVLLVTISVVSSAAAVSRKNALHRERELRAIAQAAQRSSDEFAAKARREAELSRRTQEFLASIIEASDPVDEILVNHTRPSHQPLSMVSLLGHAEVRIREQLKDQPVTQARLMDTLGNACRAAAMFEQAQGLLDDAETVRRAIKSPEVDLSRDRMRNELHRARLVHDLGQREGARQRYRRLIEQLRALGRPAELELATTLFFYGKLQSECGLREPASASFSECLEIRRRHLNPDSVGIKAAEIALALSRNAWQDQLATLLNEDDWSATIAVRYLEVLGRREVKDYDRACEVYAGLTDELATRMGDRSVLVLMAKGDYAGLLYDAGRFDEAERVINVVLHQVPRVARHHPHVRRAKLRIAFEMLHAGRIDEAAELYDQQCEFYPSIQEYPEELTLGLIWTGLGRRDSDQLLKYASALLDRPGKMPEQTAWYEFARARIDEQFGMSESAETWDRRSLRSAQAIRGRLTTGTWSFRMALIHQHHGEYERAEELLRQAVRLETNKRFAEHPIVARYRNGLADVLEKQGKIGEALRQFRETLAIWTQTLPVSDPRIRQTQSRIESLNAI